MVASNVHRSSVDFTRMGHSGELGLAHSANHPHICCHDFVCCMGSRHGPSSPWLALRPSVGLDSRRGLGLPVTGPLQWFEQYAREEIG
jgi:hypothetical protein